MAAQQGQVALVRTEAIEIRPAEAQLRRTAIVVRETIEGLLALLLGADNNLEVERWARLERVDWYRGCGR